MLACQIMAGLRRFLRQKEGGLLQQKATFWSLVLRDRRNTLVGYADWEWAELKWYRPDVVVLHLGGNYITESLEDQVEPLCREMLSCRRELRDIRARVLMGEVLPWATFGLRGLSLMTFDKIRNGLNRKLRLVLKHDCLFMRVQLRARNGDLHYHHNERDWVHLSPAGMRCYERVLKHKFGWFVWSWEHSWILLNGGMALFMATQLLERNPL